LDVISIVPNFNSIGSGVLETQVAESRYLPLTGGITAKLSTQPDELDPYGDGQQ